MTYAKEIDGELWIRADYHHGEVGAVETEWRYRYEAVKREADYWHQRHNAVVDMMVKNTLLMAPLQPKMLADAESFNAGKAMAEAAVREECAQLVEQMGIDGYGTLAIAAAIRKGQA